MSKGWYCRIARHVSGPLSFDELAFLVTRGKLAPGDELRDGPHGEWLPAARVDGLFAVEPPLQVATEESKPTAEPELPGVSVDEQLAVEEADPVEDAATPPVLPRDHRRARQVALGSSIGAGIAALILLLAIALAWLLAPGGGGGGGLADRGSGLGSGQADAGGGAAGEESGRTSNDEAGGDTQSSEAVEVDGQRTTRDDRQARTGGSRQPDVELPDLEFTLQQREAPSGAANGTGQGGNGGGAGEFKERVAREGGKSGDVQVTLVWNNINDLDLHVVCPSGVEIYYDRPRGSGGHLDVDMNANRSRVSREPVENIVWSSGTAPSGEYKVLVNHYANHGATDPTSFQVAVTYKGRTRTFSGQISKLRNPTVLVHTFRL